MSDAAEKRRAYNMESRGYTRSPTGKKETLLRGPETYAIACRTNAFVSIKTESLSLHLGVIPAGCTYQSGDVRAQLPVDIFSQLLLPRYLDCDPKLTLIYPTQHAPFPAPNVLAPTPLLPFFQPEADALRNFKDLVERQL